MKAKTIFRITGLALAAFVLVSNGLTFAISAVANNNAQVMAFLNGNQMIYLLIDYACVYGIGFLVYWLVIRKLPHAVPGDQTFTFGRLFRCFCIAYALAISSNVIATAISLITGNQTNISARIADLVDNGGIAIWVIMIIVAPAVEELIFRKFLIDRTKRFGEKYAIIFSAVCFGLFHMNLQQFIYAMAIGMVFGYIYSRSGKIHYTMIMHSIINAIGYLVSLVAGPMLDSMEDMDISSLLNGDGSSLASLDPGSLVLLWVVEQAILVIIALGIVFFIREVRKVRFDYSSPDCLQKGKVFSTIYLNIGVILFVLLCLAGIVISFLGGLQQVAGNMS